MSKAVEYAGLVGRFVRMEIANDNATYIRGMVSSVMDWAEDDDAVEVAFEGGGVRTIRTGEAWRFWIMARGER